MNQWNLEARQLDALREIANIGGGHAATVLGQMANRTVMIGVPAVRLVPVSEFEEGLGGAEDELVGVFMRMLGDLLGGTLLVVSQAQARALCGLLFHAEAPGDGPLNDLQKSSLMETGNILASAFMNALADFFQMTLLPSVPHMFDGTGKTLLQNDEVKGEADLILSAETSLEVIGEGHKKETVQGQFLFLLDEGSLRKMVAVIDEKFGGR
ncbi:MAG: chemotaxis protein CheC [Gemmatimonadota bacterium]|nr:chemotaxis protein CheC [Gemmatimonadota bacterium]